MNHSVQDQVSLEGAIAMIKPRSYTCIYSRLAYIKLVLSSLSMPYLDDSSLYLFLIIPSPCSFPLVFFLLFVATLIKRSKVAYILDLARFTGVLGSKIQRKGRHWVWSVLHMARSCLVGSFWCFELSPVSLFWTLTVLPNFLLWNIGRMDT